MNWSQAFRFRRWNIRLPCAAKVGRPLPCITLVGLLLQTAAPSAAAANADTTNPNAANPAAAATAKPNTTKPNAAEPNPANLALAKERYSAGVKAYDSGLYKDAIVLFLEADHLVPSANLSFNIARAYDKIMDTENSLAWYRDYLRRAPEAEDRAAVEALVHELAGRLQAKGVQQITVLSTPAAATVIIDGRPVGVTPWTGQLPPGTYQLSVERRGFSTASKGFVLSPSDPLELSLSLQPEAVSAEPPASPNQTIASVAATTSDGPSAPTPESSAWPWISLGVGASALAVAGAFELVRRGAERDARETRVQLEYEANLQTMQQHQLTARVATAVGGTALLIGGAWLLFDWEDETKSGVELSSVDCGAEGCSLTLEGAF